MAFDTEQRWQQLCDKHDAEGYRALTALERTWFNARVLIDAIQNGGAISYFYNSGADNLDDCLNDLSLLKAPDVRTQLERVAALFGSPVPRSIDARNDIINSWPDDEGNDSIEQLLAEIDDLLMPLTVDLETKLALHLNRSGAAT